MEALSTHIYTGKSVFITGTAGSGKSTLLRAALSALPPPPATVVTATTGTAAVALRGQTLHRWAQIDTKTGQANTGSTAKARWRRVQTLVIDEVSMLPLAVWASLDEAARAARNNPAAPFGGVQLVLCGDFLQLPAPSTAASRSDNPAALSQAGSMPPRPIYATTLWRQLFADSTVYLEAPRRQRADDPLSALALEVRRGLLTAATKAVLDSRLQPTPLRPGQTAIVSRRKEARIINEERLRLLDGPEVSVKPHYGWRDIPVTERRARTWFKEDDSDVDWALSTVRLKVGARCMITRNLDVAAGLSNGTFVTVTGLGAHPPRADVVTDAGLRLTLHRIRTRLSGKEDERYVEHMPLALAWAVTVHKVQGQTLNHEVLVDPRHTFSTGQLYVALTRTRTMQQLWLAAPIEQQHVQADACALEYYERLRAATAAGAAASVADGAGPTSTENNN